MTGRLGLLDLTPVREVAAYRRVWVGSLLSGLGGRMTTFAVALQVFTLTGSSAAVGGVAVAALVPTLVVGLLGGLVADSSDRRLLVLTTTAALTLVSGALAAQAFSHNTHLGVLYALVAVQAVLQAFATPAQRAVIPAVLPPQLLASGLALGQLSFQVTLVGGPALAGLVAAVGGVPLCYLVDVLSFVASLYAVWRLPALRPDQAARRSPGAVLEGIRFARAHPVVGGALLSDLAATALAMPFAIFPALNAAHFGGRPATLGLLGSAPAVGGVLAMVGSGRVRHLTRPGVGLLVAGGVWGLALATFGLVPSLAAALGALAVAGAADTLAVVLRSSLVQLATPDGLRGRISSLEYVVGVGGPELGNARGGLVAGAFGVTTSAVSGGLSVVVALGLLAVALPSLRNARLPD